MGQKALWCVTGFALISLACGDDAGEKTAEAGSGVDPNTALHKLSDADLQRVCRWMNQVADDSSATQEQSCTLQVLDDAVSVADCEAMREQCVAENASAGADAPFDCTGFEAAELPAGCVGLSVSQLESCFSDLVDAADARAQAAACEDVTKPAASTTPLSCANNIDRDCLFKLLTL